MLVLLEALVALALLLLLALLDAFMLALCEEGLVARRDIFRELGRRHPLLAAVGLLGFAQSRLSLGQTHVCVFCRLLGSLLNNMLLKFG